MLGTVGQLLILVSFVACGLAGVAYFQAAHFGMREWRRIGQAAWGVVTTALLGTAGVLWYLLFTHQFQFAYVYEQSSLASPPIFLFSAFWAGQEGSFLLWALFMALVGVALIRWTRDYEAPVMTVVAFCQLFLLSMIVGLKIGSVPVGSSPFQTLAEKFPQAPMLQVPGFVPADGSGLNDLLQNYWMAIHPPTLFVGFTLMIVPFAFAIAALWQRKYTEWVRPALPWTLAAVAILGTGIALGGYWAYETLSFGGYWAWDPVENSSLVPWLTGIAAVHAMIIQKKSGRGHKAALFLAIVSFMLVIYSTFLTRSGILGDVSVHSFVDLGLMNQLLLWILAMGIAGFGLFAYRYRELPAPDEEPAMLSREFMIFAGALLLCAVAAVVFVGTSSPILGRFFREAPSTVPISFYNKWSLPISIGITFLAGLGQLFWWHKMSVENVNRVLLKPIAFSVASTIAVLLFTPFVEQTVRAPQAATAPAAVAQAGLLGGVESFWSAYGEGVLILLLLFVAFFALYGNAAVLLRIARGNPKMAGGALTHIGFALLILGIIASSGFSRPLARDTGVQIGSSRDNFVLTRGETRAVSGYQVTYAGMERTSEGRPRYVLDFVDPQGRSFTVKPVVYKSNKDQWIQHPDHQIFPEKDVFVAVAPNVMFETTEEERGGQLTLRRGESTTIGNEEYTIAFVDYDTNVDPSMVPDSVEVAVASVLQVTNLSTEETRELRPIYLIMQDRSQQFIQNRVTDWGLTVTFAGMNVDDGSINLVVEGVPVTPEDWLVVQAYEKPFINVMWFGFGLLTLGFGVSAYRRTHDAKHSRF